MKRGVIVGVSAFLVVFSLFLVSLIPHFVSADDEPGVWDSGFTVELADEDRQFKNGHPCEVKKIYSTARTTLKGKHYYSYPERDSYCGLYTDYGFTDEFYYAFTGGQDKVHDLDGPINYFRHFPNHITTMSVAAPWNTSQRIISYYDYDFYKDVLDSYIKTGSSQPTLRKNLGTAMNSNDPFLMQYSDNQPISMGQYGVSENGRYIAFVERDKKAIVLHNTVTKTYTTVSRDTINTGSFGSIAVTNDGSAVLINGTGVSSATNSSGKLAIKLYKTEGCTQTVNAQVFVSTLSFDVTGCETVDLTSQLGEVLGENPGYWGADTAYFHPRNHYLQAAFLVQRDKDGNPTSGRKYVRFTPSNTPEERGYLAMGDSFSSGEGDLQGGDWYEPGTDEHGDEGTFLDRNLCHVSRRSYPYLLAKRLGYLQGSEQTPITPAQDGDFHSVACSGAVIHNVVGESPYGEDQSPGNGKDFALRDNQYIYLRNTSLGAWLQGVSAQVKSVNGSEFGDGEQRVFNPEVITLGIGGNDANFGKKITDCAKPTTCKYAAPLSEGAKNTALEIAGLKSELSDAYRKIKQEASENTRIYVHGYPNFIDTSDFTLCGGNVPFDERELIFISEGIGYMNLVVEAAASEAGVFYVDISTALDGTQLCSGASEEESSFNGVTAGDDISNLLFDYLTNGVCALRNGCLGNESFHPNQAGHTKYASIIESSTAGLTAIMPEAAETQIPQPNEAFFGTDAADMVNQMNEARFNPQPLNFMLPSHNASLQFEESQILFSSGGFEQNSLVELIVKSEPISLGQYLTNSQGFIEVEIVLPEGLEPGMHTIHAVGNNQYGQAVDSYASFFIGLAPSDLDGDGVLDVDDSCQAIPNSFIDIDQDGIDDACDDSTVVEVILDDNEDDQGEDNDNQGEDEDSNSDEPEEKGKPNKETVAGTDKESLRTNNFQGTVLAATTDDPEVLAQTGKPIWVPELAGASIIISAIMLFRKSKTYYAKKR